MTWLAAYCCLSCWQIDRPLAAIGLPRGRRKPTLAGKVIAPKASFMVPPRTHTGGHKQACATGRFEVFSRTNFRLTSRGVFYCSMNPSVEAHEFIDNHSIVLEAFGRWPSFHDGEVHRVVIDRTRRHADGAYYPSIELLVRGWNMTSDVTEAGFYRLESDSLVHFLFEEVTDVEFDGLNHQNVLSGLDFDLEQAQEGKIPRLSVDLCHCYGLSGRFKARRASVLSVTPYVE